MQIHTGLESLPNAEFRGCVVTWGVFDGVHRGHRKVLAGLVEWARAKGAPSLVITFDRHPAEVLQGREVPLVTTLEQRLRLIGECGVNHLLLLAFTKEFARTTAEEFIRDVVAGRAGASGVLLGYDSQFGRDRAGNIAVLRSLGERLGLEVRDAEPELHDGRPLSSSLLRELIAAGRLGEASALLGRPVAISGTVVRGAGRGAGLGFPTANLAPHHRIRLPNGVYAVRVDLDGKRYAGAANFGIRPTFEHGVEPRLEVHLLDFAGDLVGRELEVQFLNRIRDERRFAGPDELADQIRRDLEAVRSLFSSSSRDA